MMPSMNSPISTSTSTPADPVLDVPNALPPLIAWTRIVAVASLLALIVLCLAWELWLAPTGNKTLALKALPLAIPLAGFLKNRMYTYRWFSLFIWFYATEGCIRAYGDRGPSVPLAIAEVVLCLIMFAACSLHVRWRFSLLKKENLKKASA
jgi:uncharacterized membrane protein